MVIQKLIVHLIEKQADSGQSSLSLSDENISASPALERFVDELNKTYNSKATKVFGSFIEPDSQSSEDDNDQPDNMKMLLATYLENQSLENQSLENPDLKNPDLKNQGLEKQAGFIEYTHQAMSLLKHYIDQASKATGGYMIFIHYTLFGSDFMLIAMLNNQLGVSVNKKLEINNIDYLDINKLHLAARIDLTQWQDEPESGRYISMIRAKESHKLSEYFRKFIGSDETIDSKQETTELFTAVNQFCDNQIENDEKKSQFKQKAAEFCIDQADRGQNVLLNDFSNYVADAEIDDFMNYVKSEQFSLAKEISPNKSVIRRFNKLSGRNAQVSITINEEALGETVIFDAEKETLTITDLPATLKAQLLNH